MTKSMDMSLGSLQEMVRDRDTWACCSSRGHKELDMTELLNNTTNDISGNINFNHLVKIVFPSVFTVKLLFVPFAILF